MCILISGNGHSLEAKDKPREVSKTKGKAHMKPLLRPDRAYFSFQACFVHYFVEIVSRHSGLDCSRSNVENFSC